MESGENENFLEVCQNWGTEECRLNIGKWKFIKDDREGIQLYPLRKKVDKICRNCGALSIKECPDCGSQDIAEMTGFNPKKSKKIMGSTYAYKNCDFSFTKARLI